MNQNSPTISIPEKTPNTVRFLVFGDVVGSHGRKAVAKGLELWKKSSGADVLIVNIENIAHGLGLSPSSVQEALQWQASVYTTGDHAWDNKAGIASLEDKTLPIIRPANYDANVAGRGYHVFSLVPNP